MKKLTSLSLAVTLLCGAAWSQADTLSVPIGQQAGASASQLPSNGTSSAQVAQRHGQPTTRHPAVGQPPISRWDYPGFSVYFEHDKVIHSVRQHQPRTQ